MTVVHQLLDILGIDGDIERNSQSIASVAAALADNRLLLETQVAVEEARATLREQETQRRDLELVMGTSQGKSRQLESKLYGGTVRNPRELEDMQLELNLFREQQKQEEEDLLLALEASEETERGLGSLENTLQQMQTIWQEEHERLLEERTQLQDDSVLLERKRQDLSSQVNPEHMKLYDAVRSVRQRQAVAKVERGMCQGCRISLPTSVVQQARTSHSLVQCPSCSRILYAS